MSRKKFFDNHVETDYPMFHPCKRTSVREAATYLAQPVVGAAKEVGSRATKLARHYQSPRGDRYVDDVN